MRVQPPAGRDGQSWIAGLRSRALRFAAGLLVATTAAGCSDPTISTLIATAATDAGFATKPADITFAAAPVEKPTLVPTDAAFAASVPVGHTRFSNDSLSGLFTDLVFDTEWGETVPRLLRLEAPVSVGLEGPNSTSYTEFVDALLMQISREVGIAIGRAAPPNGLVVRFVPGNEWAPLDGNQCVIVFGRPAWRQFLQNRRRYSNWQAVDQADLSLRTVFIPTTNEPHEVRECLIEEITQALGPANDIYGLGPSIFNDDDAHVWPTRLDYLMLRVLYDPEMSAGIGRREARLRARRILDRINPDGMTAPVLPDHRQMDFLKWRRHLHDLFDLINSGSTETAKARAIVASILEEARMRAPNSPYHCEALSVAATLESERSAAHAMPVLDQARDVCARAHGETDIRGAELRLARAVALLSQKQDRRALEEVSDLPQRFRAYGQEAQLAIAHAVRWTALHNLNDPKAAEAKKLAVVWTIYAFGEDHDAVQRWRSF